MKRGFLLRAEEKKSCAKRRPGSQKLQTSIDSPLAPSAPLSVLQNLGGFDVDSQGCYLLGKALYGNLTDEQKALPSDYELNKSRFRSVYKDFTESSKDAGDIITIPQHVPDDETPCQWIVNGSTKEKVLNAPGYPARIPKPSHPELFQVRSTPEMGVGLFAKRNIKGGDVFLVERPLIVSPRALKTWSQGGQCYTSQQIHQIVMLEFESNLEYAISRLPIESQADYRALHNAHTSDGSGPLLGVMRSNAYCIGNLYDGSNKTDLGRYGAVCKIGSRINHSCIPNVSYYFKLNSFSVQFFALRDIEAGEQLFYSYASAEGTRTQRQAELAPYGFVCRCPACDNATPESDELRTTFGPKTTLISKMILENPSRVNEAMIQDALQLKKDLVRYKLDTNFVFIGLLASISLGYRKLGKLKESEAYLVLMKAHKKCYKEDE